MDANGRRVSTIVDENGYFDLTLAVGHSYVIGFSDGDTFLGVLTFSTDTMGELAGSSIHLSGSTEELNLGDIRFGNGLAVPEINPMELEDQDADGTCDRSDDDFDYEAASSCERA
jgi:hypothetical protein